MLQNVLSRTKTTLLRYAVDFVYIVHEWMKLRVNKTRSLGVQTSD